MRRWIVVMGAVVTVAVAFVGVLCTNLFPLRRPPSPTGMTPSTQYTVPKANDPAPDKQEEPRKGGPTPGVSAPSNKVPPHLISQERQWMDIVGKKDDVLQRIQAENSPPGWLPTGARGDACPDAASPRVGAASCDGIAVPYVTMVNLQEVLGCAGQTMALALQVRSWRLGDVLSFCLWTPNCRRVLRTPGFRSLETVKCGLVGEGGVVPRDDHLRFSDHGVTIVDVPVLDKGQISGGKRLLIQIQQRTRESPLGDYAIHAAMISKGYRFVAGIKVRSYYRPVGVLIFDLERLDIAVDVPVPGDPIASDVKFVLVPKHDFLLAVSSRLEWCVALDLKPLAARPVSK